MRAAFERLSERDRATLLTAAGWEIPGSPGEEVETPSGGALAVRLHRARGRLKAQVEALGTVPTLLIALAVVAALLVTPPGRAGVTWAIELIGVGDVGESPTKADRTPFRPTSGPLVVDNGRAPDGSRYEWVAHRGGLPAFRGRAIPRGWRPGDPLPKGHVRRVPAGTGLCLVFEWPTRRARGERNGCWPKPHRYPPVALQSAGPIQSLSWFPVQGKLERVARPDVVLVGTTSGAVDRLELRYASRGGSVRLPVDFARVDGRMLRRLGMPPGKPEPFATFTAFVPGRLVARDGLIDRFPEATMLVDRRLRTGDRRTDTCMRRLGRPPLGAFSLAAYGPDGRRVDVKRTLEGPLPRPCWRWWPPRRIR